MVELIFTTVTRKTKVIKVRATEWWRFKYLVERGAQRIFFHLNDTRYTSTYIANCLGGTLILRVPNSRIRFSRVLLPKKTSLAYVHGIVDLPRYVGTGVLIVILYYNRVCAANLQTSDGVFAWSLTRTADDARQRLSSFLWPTTAVWYLKYRNLK